MALYPELKSFIEARIAEFDRIPAERRERLGQLTRYVQTCIDEARPIQLTFVCTHNSRRSQWAQIWAEAAAAFYWIPQVRAFSGGTERSAFNPRAVEAARRAGFEIEMATDGKNPVYQIRTTDRAAPVSCFSKGFSDAPNPREAFCAVMVCSDADRACPAVPGATARVAIPFEDPKSSDGTPQESATYDERCAQIAREVLFMFSEVRSAPRSMPVRPAHP